MKWIRNILMHDEALGYGALALAITLFSTIEITVKLIGPGFPPLRLAALRFLLTGLVLLAPALGKLRLWIRRPTRADFLILLMLAFFGVAISLSFYHLSLRHLPANVGAIVFSANPVFVVLFAPFLVGEKPTWRKTAAVILASLGVAVFVVGGQDMPPGWGRGVLYMTIAQITFALYSVLSKKYMPRFGATVITCFAGLLGGLAILPFSWWVEGTPFVAIAAGVWLKLLFLAVVVTALPYLLYFYGMVQVGASRGAMFFFLKPVLASIFAYVVLHEQMTPRVVAGAVVIMAALALVLFPSRARPSPVTPA